MRVCGLPELGWLSVSSQAAFTLNRIQERQVVEGAGYDRLERVSVCETWQKAAEMRAVD
jgi:hypothetical protein